MARATPSAAQPTALARLRGCSGALGIGFDADIAIWDPEREVTITLDMLHDEMDYTPYEGKVVRGWPVTTLLRGRRVCDEFEYLGTPGDGEFLRCDAPHPAAEWSVNQG